jgi:hypothetical protein
MVKKVLFNKCAEEKNHMPKKDIRKLIKETDIKKETTVSTLTDSEIKIAVEMIADEDGLSVSSVIASIIRSYLRDNKALNETNEKRRKFERKNFDFPSLIGNSQMQAHDLIMGTVLDISHGGIRFSIPRGAGLEINNSGGETFVVIFTLPNFNVPIRLECRSQRVFEYEDEVHVGATIINPDCSLCLALQQCMT